MHSHAKSLLRVCAAAASLVALSAAPAAASTGGIGVFNAGETRAVPKEQTVPSPPLTASEFRGSGAATGGVRFGSRVLREGMSGHDVRVLNGIVRAKDYGSRIRLNDRFHAATSTAVRRFQSENSIRPSGVVTRRTARALAGSMRRANTTWYGPGFYGNQTACGQTLRYGTVGVAHRRLPCGTRVTFHHKGQALVARVIDRGPFVSGIKWDLTGAAARKLGFSGSGPIRFEISG